MKHLTEENQQRTSSFFLFHNKPIKEQMKKLIALLTKEKKKWMGKNSDFLRAWYSIHTKIRIVLFLYLLVNLLIGRLISSAKSYKYLNKLIS